MERRCSPEAWRRVLTGMVAVLASMIGWHTELQAEPGAALHPSEQHADHGGAVGNFGSATAVTHLYNPVLEPSEAYAVQDMPLFKKQPRDGFLQRVFFSATRVGADTDQLSATELDVSATVGFPFPTRESPVLITAAFGADLLDVDSLDLPDELYEVTLEARFIRPITDRWTADLSVKPGAFGSSDTDSADFRLQGRAIGIYQWRPQTKALLGIAYLDREDISMLPVVGLIWTPTDYLKLDLLFPQPRLALRTNCDCCSAWWLYLGGEFGGGSWGIRRADGSQDTATLSDWRFLVGMERESDGLSARIEGGIGFNRRLEYVSGVGDTDLDTSVFLRTAIWY